MGSMRFLGIYEDYLRENTKNKFWLVNTNKLINFSSEKEVVPGDIIKVKVVAAKTWSLDGEAI